VGGHRGRVALAIIREVIRTVLCASGAVASGSCEPPRDPRSQASRTFRNLAHRGVADRLRATPRGAWRCCALWPRATLRRVALFLMRFDACLLSLQGRPAISRVMREIIALHEGGGLRPVPCCPRCLSQKTPPPLSARRRPRGGTTSGNGCECPTPRRQPSAPTVTCHIAPPDYRTCSLGQRERRQFGLALRTRVRAHLAREHDTRRLTEWRRGVGREPDKGGGAAAPCHSRRFRKIASSINRTFLD
jgi:hypothetical protein